MRFFVPHASDDKQAETVWASVRAFLLQQGFPTENRRIWKLRFRHNSKSYALEVGREHPDLRENVIIILRAVGQELYYVCTAHRGVIQGEPYLVGIDHHTAALDFEA